MGKFIYKLENILKLKERIYEQRTQELKEVNLELEKAVDVKNEYLFAMKLERDKFSNLTGLTLTANDIKEQSRKVAFLKGKVIEADEFIAEIEKRRDEVQERLIEAYREKEVQNKLKEKKYEEWYEEQKTKEQNLLDEMVNNRK